MTFKKIMPLILAIILLFSGCSGKKDYESGKPIIAVSIIPQATFLSEVAWDNFDIITVIPSGASPETYEPSPQEMRLLEKAELYFAIGVPAEEKILKTLNKGTEIIHLEKEIAKEYPERTEDGGRDPHIWLSPKRVAVAVKKMAEALFALDTENGSIYKENAQKYCLELEKLDGEIKNILSTDSSRKFIAFHPAFGYFAEDYGLDMYALEEHGKEATAKRLAEMADLAKKEDIKVIFYQAEASNRQAEAFAEEIGGKAVSLEPLAADYTANLLKMANALSEAIK